MLRTGQPGGRRAEPAGAGREAVAAADPWESDLRNQRLRVNDAFRRFSRAHLAQEGTDWPGARTSDLRGRIELCAFQAGRDSWQAAR
jgi:hypothetical protein